MTINEETKLDNEPETHVIEIHTFPQSFTIVGMSKGDAILEAQRRFYAATTGLSIYETNVIE